MIYLNAGFFKPFVILLTIAFLPLLVTATILVVLNFEMGLLIVAIVFFMVYIAIIIGVYIHTKSHKFYLTISGISNMSINYPNVKSETISCNEIIKIEYYKILSVKAWCMLYSYVMPQCAYITYKCDGEERCELIGYPKYREIKNLCDNIGINFVVK